MRGRKPRPTALKKLAGNPGRRPLNDHEPMPKPGNLEPPSWLDAGARAEWSRIVPELIAVGIFSVLDRPALEAYCTAYSRWRATEEKISKLKAIIFKTKTGYPQILPHVSAAHKYLSVMRDLLPEFGMTPASRSRISATPEKAASDDDEFLNPPQQSVNIPHA